MSVPKGDRREGELKVLIDARELAAYTIMITKNPKVFEPAYNTAITNDIISTAKDIYISAWHANRIRVNGSKEKAEERRKYQEQAISSCEDLLPLIMIAKRIFHLSGKRVKYWGKKTVDVETLLIAWKNADRKRYA